ncbi:MAG: hypothetical protein F6K53_38185 [Moorea sp. SIO4A1]|uniref:hypothetical protein n=1 Tax=Moorena sp. SIO4A1 TaxID=2607835 RepID=UPI00144E9118|nr:hypothetical protein [Moorena sp. SIO4A1]NEQ62882.1 hypothetical protein [Moorena sp. SIO4A1]
MKSLYYFSEIEPSIRKSHQILRERGIIIVGINKKKLLNQPYYYINQRLYGKPRWFAEDLEKVLIERNISFCQETMEFSVNIKECFIKESQVGKQLLDFMVGANTAYFSPLQLRLLLDYFGTCAQKMEGGEIMLPHSGILFYLEKERVSA